MTSTSPRPERATPIEGDLVDRLAAAWAQAQGVVRRMPDAAEREFGISPSRTQALHAVGAGGAQRVNDVAELLDISVSSASRTVDALVQEGLVDRRIDPAHRRAVLLTLTPDGEALLQRLLAWSSDITQALLDRLGEDLAARVADGLLAFSAELETELDRRYG